MVVDFAEEKEVGEKHEDVFQLALAEQRVLITLIWKRFYNFYPAEDRFPKSLKV